MDVHVQLLSEYPNMTHMGGGFRQCHDTNRVASRVVYSTAQAWVVGVGRPPMVQQKVEFTKPQIVAITILAIEEDGCVVLRRKEPLELVAERDEGEDCYYTDFPDLDVPIAGYTREDLISSAHALVVSTWRRCMGADEPTLAPLAIKLRERLRTQYDEVEDAATAQGRAWRTEEKGIS